MYFYFNLIPTPNSLKIRYFKRFKKIIVRTNFTTVNYVRYSKIKLTMLKKNLFQHESDLDKSSIKAKTTGGIMI